MEQWKGRQSVHKHNKLTSTCFSFQSRLYKVIGYTTSTRPPNCSTFKTSCLVPPKVPELFYQEPCNQQRFLLSQMNHSLFPRVALQPKLVQSAYSLLLEYLHLRYGWTSIRLKNEIHVSTLISVESCHESSHFKQGALSGLLKRAWIQASTMFSILVLCIRLTCGIPNRQILCFEFSWSTPPTASVSETNSKEKKDKKVVCDLLSPLSSPARLESICSVRLGLSRAPVPYA